MSSLRPSDIVKRSSSIIADLLNICVTWSVFSLIGTRFMQSRLCPALAKFDFDHVRLWPVRLWPGPVSWASFLCFFFFSCYFFFLFCFFWFFFCILFFFFCICFFCLLFFCFFCDSWSVSAVYPSASTSSASYFASASASSSAFSYFSSAFSFSSFVVCSLFVCCLFVCLLGAGCAWAGSAHRPKSMLFCVDRGVYLGRVSLERCFLDWTPKRRHTTQKMLHFVSWCTLVKPPAATRPAAGARTKWLQRGKTKHLRVVRGLWEPPWLHEKTQERAEKDELRAASQTALPSTAVPFVGGVSVSWVYVGVWLGVCALGVSVDWVCLGWVCLGWVCLGWVCLLAAILVCCFFFFLSCFFLWLFWIFFAFFSFSCFLFFLCFFFFLRAPPLDPLPLFETWTKSKLAKEGRPSRVLPIWLLALADRDVLRGPVIRPPFLLVFCPAFGPRGTLFGHAFLWQRDYFSRRLNWRWGRRRSSAHCHVLGPNRVSDSSVEKGVGQLTCSHSASH